MKKLFALLLTVLMLMSLTAVAVVATGESQAKAPIVFRFNNEDMLENWYNAYGGGFKADYKIVDGVASVDGCSTDGHGVVAFSYRFNNGDVSFKLTDYPVVKAKYKIDTSYTGGACQFYIWTPDKLAVSEKKYFLSAPSATKNQWVTYTRDFSQDADFAGFDGVLDSTRSFELWYRYHEEEIPVTTQVEYIAFFPDKASADAFDAVNPAVQGSSDAYMPYYTDVNGIFTAVQTAVDAAEGVADIDAAKTLVQNAYNTALAANTPEGMVLDTKFTAYRNLENTKFIVKASVTETSSPIEARLITEKSFEVAKKDAAEGSDDSVIFRFNNEDMLKDWYNAYGGGFKDDYKIVDGVASVDGCSTDGYGVVPFSYSFAKSGKRFNLADYPHVKVKYKIATEYTGGSSQLYLWKADPDGSYFLGSPSAAKNKWNTYYYAVTGAGQALRENRSFEWWYRGHDKEIPVTTSLEYIAFFPDKASADAFDAANPTVQGSSDAYLPYKAVGEEFIAKIREEAAKATAAVKSADEAKAAVKAAADKVIADSQIDPAQISYTVGEAKEVTGGYAVEVEIAVGPKETRSYVTGEIAVSDNIPAPVIWRFNNQEMVDLWSLYHGKGENTLADGVMRTNFTSNDTANVTDLYYRGDSIPEEYRVDLDNYPYIKAKFKYDGELASSAVHMYMYNTASTGTPYFTPTYGDSGVWHTAKIDATSTAIKKSGSTGEVTYGGDLKKFGFWFWHKGSGSSDIEYIAFFHKDDKAAWEAFDTAEGVASTTAGTSDKFLPYYNEINAIADAGAAAVAADDTKYPTYDKAASAIEAMFKAEAAKLGNIDVNDVTVTAEAITKAETEATYKVSVYTGSVEARVIATETVKANIRSSVVWHFGNPDFIKKLSPGAAEFSVGVENGNVFMHGVRTNTADNFNFTYSGINNDHDIELSDYPIVAVRCRSDKGGTLQFYFATTTSGNTGATSSFRRESSHNGTGEWQTVYIDTAKVDQYGAWSGKLTYLRTDMMRFGGNFVAGQYTDVDYIGFFATMEDAQAYTKKVEGDTAKVDAAIDLVEDALNTDYTDVSTKEDAETRISEILSAIPEDVHTKVELVGYETTDPTIKDDTVGYYKFRVFFINGPTTSAAVKYVDCLFRLMPQVEFTVLGAQIREYVSEAVPQGLRFGVKLNKALWKDVDVTNVSYGMVVAPVRFAAHGLTLETPNAVNVPAKNIFAETPDEITYTAVVTNIPESENSTQVAARAYVKYTFAGEDYTVYADSTKIRSVNDVKNLSGEGYEEYPQLLGNVTYDRETWMTPFWEGNTVYHELFWPVMPDGADENDDLVIDLLYTISDVIVVKNGTHTKDYYEGKDYYVNENGQLVIPAGSDIKRMPFEEYVSDTPKVVVGAMNGTRYEYKKISTDLPEYADYVGKYLYFTEGAEIQAAHQYSISYRHTAEWDENATLPAYEEDALPRTRQMLANKEAINIGYFGDSITAGGNQTGSFGVSPNTPHWRNVIATTLESMYGYTEGGNRIYVRSEAHGGMTSQWGRNGGGTNVIANDPTIPDGYAAHRFAANTSYANKNGIPDLFILAFGMNDEGRSPADFKANNKNIVEQILTLNPNCEFVLVSTSMPNPLWSTTKCRTQYEAALEELVTEMRAEGVNIDVANLQGMHKYFLTKKEYRDMTGNNMNHQNDMLSRLYAQTIVTTIAGECK